MFAAKFQMFARDCGWDSARARTQLCLTLQGDAGIFTTALLKREPDITYEALMEKLERHFGVQELPEMAQMEFSYARQAPEETCSKWASRLLMLASQAYPDMSDEHVQGLAVMRFCQGLADREAGKHALTSLPKHVQAAVELVKRYQLSHRAIFGKTRKDARSISHSIEEERVRKVSVPPTPPPAQPVEKRVTTLEDSVGLVRKQLDGLASKQGTIEASLQSLAESMKKLTASPGRFRGRSPARGNPSPARSDLCFSCGKKGHFQRDCPERLTKPSVSFVMDQGNYPGSEEEVQPRPL